MMSRLSLESFINAHDGCLSIDHVLDTELQVQILKKYRQDIEQYSRWLH